MEERNIMPVEAKVILDSISEEGNRLITVEAKIHRFILAELNTHRSFCLAGDSMLEFDLPAGSAGSDFRVYRMRLDEFADKWINGARRYKANPKQLYDISWIKPEYNYSSVYAASQFGMASASNINQACRCGIISAKKSENGRTWMIKGSDLIKWREKTPEHTRFDIRSRLSKMKIRQLNETTNDIQWSTVKNVCVSGIKDVYEVIAGDYNVAGSEDHLIYTLDGYKKIKELKVGDSIVVRKYGKQELEDPNRLRVINGIYRSTWQKNKRNELREIDTLCRKCRSAEGSEIHHIEPVYVNPSRAFDEFNITLLCYTCHKAEHIKQGWQGGNNLYGASVKIEQINYRGKEMTYDLEISGEYPNFLANGVVVHNSRNSASSRAIPIEKQIDRVLRDPAIPLYWGKNQSGMQAKEELSPEEIKEAEFLWRDASMDAVSTVRKLQKIGLHKQTANRLLEPFMWHTVIITATEWQNFFDQRCHPDAQPEMQAAAVAIRNAINNSKPTLVGAGRWHLPYTDDIDWSIDLELLKQISVARCARVSYLTHDGVRDIMKDIELYNKLSRANPPHLSPFEHVARPINKGWSDLDKTGNFKGWIQFRHDR